MDSQRIDELRRVYRDGLLDDVVPFWLKHGVDLEHGGYMTAVDRTGNVVDTDKSVWFQGRFAWLLSELCNSVGPNDEWLAAARSGVNFLRQHCFDSDGRMFFLVTRDGRPLRKRRYVFSELFAVIAYAAFAKAAGDQQACDEASQLFRQTVKLLRTPGALPEKIDSGTRPTRGFGVPMILLNTASIVRDCIGDQHDNAAFCTAIIEDCIREIRSFLNDKHKAVMECTGPHGELLDHFDGRLLNPGHAIEGAWFVLNEAAYRGGDKQLIELGCTMLDWMWKWGWDEQHGGITYFRDVRGLPVQEYWHDMKFWWPQNEAIIATLMAWQMTGEQRYSDWHRLIHDWTYKKFPDATHGEWFGYLHRDGSVSNESKGTMWKGPFHIPRMQLMCWKMLQAKPAPATR